MMKARALVAAVGVACCGCASVPPAQVGQTVGAIIGSAIAPGLGAPLGSLAGLLGGMLVQGRMEKATEGRERKTLGEQLAAGSPTGPDGSPVETGEPARVWVDETVQQGRLIAGHFETRTVPMMHVAAVAHDLPDTP